MSDINQIVMVGQNGRQHLQIILSKLQPLRWGEKCYKYRAFHSYWCIQTTSLDV